MPRALALQARGLTKAYRGVVAVESLDLEVETGTILGFLGPNGAGKTTAIRMLSTILRPDAGWFAVAGVPQDQPVEIRRRVGVLPESAGYPPGQTGHEWLSFHAELFGRPREMPVSSGRPTPEPPVSATGLPKAPGAALCESPTGISCHSAWHLLPSSQSQAVAKPTRSTRQRCPAAQAGTPGGIQARDHQQAAQRTGARQ